MAATDGQQAHLLSLKVMRVSRPELSSAWQPFYSSSPSFSAHSSTAVSSLQGSTPLLGHPKTLRDLTHASELLTLPSSFGSIQLGETFSSCLCINNEKQIEIEVVQFKVEMQTVTAKAILHEMDGSGNNLAPGDTLEHIVHHEIKELGQHVLACTVTYRLPPNSRSIQGASEDTNDPSLQTFRKFYKFAVTNPLSVKTKVHSPKSSSALLSTVEREKIFLEVHIQNLTQDAICFERMRLECTDGWAVVDGNVLRAGDDERSIFSGSMALMQPQDVRQYMYILTPTSIDLSPTVHVPGSIIPLGRLDISWKSSFGEPGRLLTSMLSRRVPLLPAPQPASALPPYLKRSFTSSTPSRPHSPQLLSHSRPGTPPGQRPGSPMNGRPTATTATMPQSPLQTPITPFIAPELEAQLFIRQSPGKSVLIERPFSISFGIVLSTTIPLGKEGLRRKVALAVQFVRPCAPPVLAPTVNIEPVTPNISSPGVPTPTSAAATFNYTLAHQKILAASSRPLFTEAVTKDISNPSHSQAGFPPPYFEEEVNGVSSSSGVVPVGPSLLFLPPVELGLSSNQREGLSKAQLTQEFEMTFVALQRGFSTVGGVRIFVVDDNLDEGENKRMKSQTRTRVLKEYDVVGELWVSTSQPSS
ncbi:DUF974-domain-containing protein [Phlegmacium glaucopus]|nr:DUF974-domain-containing protein [Phlegmacium glaucopus]